MLSRRDAMTLAVAASVLATGGEVQAAGAPTVEDAGEL